MSALSRTPLHPLHPQRRAVDAASSDLAFAEQLVDAARARLVELELELADDPDALAAARAAFAERAEKVAAWRRQIEAARARLGRE